MTKTRSWWGWGNVEDAVVGAERDALTARVAALLPDQDRTDHEPPDPASLELPAARVRPPDSLAAICSTDPTDRAAHAHGKAFRDVVRNLHGDLAHVPDLVIRPGTESEIVDVLDWCSRTGTAVIPYGGGSSVVGGIEPRFDGPAVTLDLAGLAAVLEVDPVSRAARIQAGVFGPELEAQLRPHGLTLRHFPQSFEFSTLGGWLATRSGGHFATLYTHIDDLVESTRAVTPVGVSESRRLPGSGAGPSPDRLLLGSEGTLGVITEAWMRLHERPRWRARASVHFADYDAAVTATRAIAQSGLYPANCRLLDAAEAFLNAGVSVPYFGIYASGRWGSTVAQWDEIKAAVSAALLANGGTITHHHAVGRDHRPWYDQQRPQPFAAALRAAKSALDPAAILNPGVLLDA